MPWIAGVYKVRDWSVRKTPFRPEPPVPARAFQLDFYDMDITETWHFNVSMMPPNTRSFLKVRSICFSDAPEIESKP